VNRTLVSALPPPPRARLAPHRTLVHGEERVDPFHWLRGKGDPAVAAYLEAENAYADAVMRPTEALQETLYGEMLSRIKETDVSAPYREGGFFYYARTEEGKQYSVRCRKKGALDAPEDVLLDLNALAEGHTYLSVGTCAVTDDGGLMLYSLDRTGFRQYTLEVKDLATGAVLPDRRERVTSAAWAADGETLFYVVEDEAKRSYRLYRHRLGSAEDVLVYEEPDERFAIGVHRTRSRAFLVLHSSSHTASEVRFLPAGEPAGEWRLVAAREADHEYDVDHRAGLFYIRTNSGGRNFRVVTAPVEDPRRERWTELVPHASDVSIEEVLCFDRHLALFLRERGLTQIRVLDTETGSSHRVDFPEPAYSVFPSANREHATRVLRYSYQSFVTPESIVDYDMATRRVTIVKRTEVLGGYDPSRYTMERIFATAKDGVLVPISLVARNGTPRDGRAPMLLSGYGSYGYPNPVVFSSSLVSLLDRGVVFAEAHVRGGGEMGKPWHDAGRMDRKTNTFTDFISAAEHVITEGYTSSDGLVIGGRSAGGLLIGAVVNMRPDLFRAAVLWVPFVDVVNTMLDASLPLTVGEYEEWGDPNEREQYERLKAYCPYTNLAAKDYPSILVKTSLNDSQVMYWEPAKYVAKLRTLKTDGNPLLFKTNMGAGHGGSSGRYDFLREVAFDYAFVLREVGIRE
jgi:oligopeptidase B